MKTVINYPIIPEFTRKFAGQRSVGKKNLWEFYGEHTPQITDQGFRRFLYSLEKQKIILPVANGLYVLQDKIKSNQDKSKFKPTLSPEVLEISARIKDTFPYIKYAIWETSTIHNFMVHQPGQSQIILEIEKEAAESVFNALYQVYPGRIWLRPNQELMERYIIHAIQPIIISNLISQSPLLTVDSVPHPGIEKILVDIFVDEEIFYSIQGQELINIYENVFNTFWVNEKSLFRYAQRRHCVDKIKLFINDRTQVKLIQDEVQ